MSIRLNNIAVLIDADNASANNIDYILQKIETIGRITCKKIYGDWGNAHIQSWQESLLKHAIDPMQHFAYVKGKNATDIGMVIEAMDLLYSGTYDGFCLISSDSDFTSLALRIRKNHVKVFGFGKRNTVSAFSQACDQFFYVEDLLPAPKMVESSINLSSSINKKITQSSIKTTNKPVEAWDEKRLKCDTKLLNSLRASIINHPKADAQCWLNLGLVGKGMKEHYPDFDPKNYGYSKLTDIIKKISLFETKVVNSTLYVRDKKSKKVTKKLIVTTSETTTRFSTEQLQSQTHLIGVINKIIRENPNSDEGWSKISYVGNQINQNYKNIKLSRYGYFNFSDLIKILSVHEMRSENNIEMIRLKTEKANLQPRTKKTALELIREYAKIRN